MMRKAFGVAARTLVAVTLAIGFFGCGGTGVAPTSPNSDAVIQHVEQVATPAAVLAAYSEALVARVKTESVQPESVVDLATIVNLGELIWQVLQDNRPVVNINSDYATALPSGVKNASALTGFSALQSVSYRIYGVNGLGFIPYDVTYTLFHNYGGSYKGKGLYLATVAIVPSSINVLVGYTVNFKVTNASTLNVGSTEAPIGSVILQMAFNVSTLLENSTTTMLYQFKGDRANVEAH